MAVIKPEDIIDLDTAVMNALDFFIKRGLPKVKLDYFKKPLVVGSGNAAETGRILFENQEAIYATESDYEAKLDTIKGIDGAVIISASGSKHAPIIAKETKRRGLKTVLLTCTRNSEAAEFVNSENVFVFEKIPEPYTYNTITYMAMILASRGGNPKAIKDFLKKKIDPLIPDYLADTPAFCIILPGELEGLTGMLTTKFIELFGRKLGKDVFTIEHAKHAVDVVETPGELYIGLGVDLDKWAMPTQRHINLPVPKDEGYAGAMAVGYYFIGKIQKAKPQWFKEAITTTYIEKSKKRFGNPISPIVE